MNLDVYKKKKIKEFLSLFPSFLKTGEMNFVSGLSIRDTTNLLLGYNPVLFCLTLKQETLYECFLYEYKLSTISIRFFLLGLVT